MEMKRIGILVSVLVCLAAALSLFAEGAASVRVKEKEEQAAPRLDLASFGFEPIVVAGARPEERGFIDEISSAAAGLSPWGGGNVSTARYATIRKSGPPVAQPGQVVAYQVELANYEAVSQTYQLTIPLPAGLTYLPAAQNDFQYDPTTRQLHWQGELPPGHLDYELTADGTSLPYLDLADFGLPSLCADFFAQGEACAAVSATFNLGVNGRSVNLYGQTYYHLVVSTDGQIIAGPAATLSGNHWLPDTAVPGLRLAGLWRPVHFGDPQGGSLGRWHAAILSGYIAGHDVFYGQWHNAPHAADLNLTARHAIAVVLDSDGAVSPLSGHIFYVYDNIADPDQTVDAGYSIGLSDSLGRRGLTRAYAPGEAGGPPPQGHPPAAGTTFHLQPVLWGGQNAYRQTFSYRALADGPVPAHIATTAYARPADPALPLRWASHYLPLRYLFFLPIVAQGEQP
jgi:hypothetical protein